MIARIWTGWTLPEKADAYERALRSVVLPRMAGVFSEGYHGAHVLRRDVVNEGRAEVEFMTVLWFESDEVIRRVTGPDLTRAHVPPESAEHLSRWDERVRHFTVSQRPG